MKSFEWIQENGFKVGMAVGKGAPSKCFGFALGSSLFIDSLNLTSALSKVYDCGLNLKNLSSLDSRSTDHLSVSTGTNRRFTALALTKLNLCCQSTLHLSTSAEDPLHFRHKTAISVLVPSSPLWRRTSSSISLFGVCSSFSCNMSATIIGQ